MTGRPYPLVCAHRGASARLPDNSLAAFEAAVASGCDAIETDLRRSPDGRIVLAHDAVDACRANVVELGSLLALSDGRVRLDLELKETGLERDVLAMIVDEPGPIVSSFLPDVLEALHALAPSLETGLLIEPPFDGDPVQLARHVAAKALMVEDALLTPELLDEASQMGHPVWAWTINDEPRLAELLAEPRLAGVITDEPERAVAIRESLIRANQAAHAQCEIGRVQQV